MNVLASVLAALILLLAVAAWLLLLLVSLEPLLWRMIRAQVAGRGWVRPSVWLARLCRGSFEHDRRGGPVLAGALALLARPTHDEGVATWLEGQMGGAGAIGAAGVVAAGLIAASRGQRDAARDLMHNASNFDAEVAPAPARVIAGEWLVADAAERGDWASVMRLGVRPDVASAQTRFLAFAAARVRRELLIDEPTATDLGLRWLWWRSADRRSTRPLLQRALASPRILSRRKPKPAPPVVAPPPIDPAEFAGEPLAYAQALHALWGTVADLERSLTPSHLIDLCRAWDMAFAGPALAQLAARSKIAASAPISPASISALSGISARAVSAAISSQTVRRSCASASSGRTTVASAWLRADLLGEVEKLNQGLRSRTVQKRGLSSVEELREWNTLRRAYERAAALGGLEVRRLMFPDIHLYVCNYAVWLWNERKEYGISTPLFRWLLAEAEAVGDEEAIILQRKNVGVK